MGHSAKVKMRLLANGRRWRIAQMRPDSVRLDPPADLPALQAEIIVSVDDEEFRWRVDLPRGASADSAEVRLALPGARLR